MEEKKKKGAPISWKPANRIGSVKAPEGYRFKWFKRTPERIYQAQQEGWKIADKIEYPELAHYDFSNRVNDSNGFNSNQLVRNDMIGMLLSNELGDSRKAYYEKETKELTESCFNAKNAKKALGKMGNAIRTGVKVIE